MSKCRVKWNPKVWPYVTSCIKEDGHQDDHEDNYGRKLVNVPGQRETEGE